MSLNRLPKWGRGRGSAGLGAEVARFRRPATGPVDRLGSPRRRCSACSGGSGVEVDDADVAIGPLTTAPRCPARRVAPLSGNLRVIEALVRRLRLQQRSVGGSSCRRLLATMREGVDRTGLNAPIRSSIDLPADCPPTREQVRIEEEFEHSHVSCGPSPAEDCGRAQSCGPPRSPDRER